ncbi:MAG: phage portal protein [Oscillospiraceae bacterium]|nr:phage portal protein [Oscillospiraceae bacterium]
MKWLDKLKNKKIHKQTYKDFKFGDWIKSFGSDPMANITVRTCINKIATECSKLIPKHIFVKDGIQYTPQSRLNYLFEFAPSPIMTPNDFIYKVINNLLINNNVYIYPLYENNRLEALYPLNPSGVDIKEDGSGYLYVYLDFKDYNITIPYENIIHLRLNYSLNDYLGTLDNKPLLSTLETSSKIERGLGKAVEVGLQVYGLLKEDNLLDEDKKTERRKEFEKQLKNSNGIIITDLAETYVQLKPDPKLVDKDTIEYIDKKIIRWYGLSEPVLNGSATDEEHEAFYNATIEPLAIALSNAFTKVLFTTNELYHGNKIKFFSRFTLQTSLKTRVNILDIAGQRGLLTVDQQLELLGYPPVGGELGAKRYISLNYISTDIIDKYQLTKKGVTPNEQ